METDPSPEAQSAPPTQGSAPSEGSIAISIETGPNALSSSRPSHDLRASRGGHRRDVEAILANGISRLDHPALVLLTELSTGGEVHLPMNGDSGNFRTLTGMDANPSRGVIRMGAWLED